MSGIVDHNQSAGSGNGHQKALHFTQPPRRVVSLVPSLTESLFELGLGASVVGITDYCIYPADALAGLPRLGGPKTPRLAEIVALQPDLVIANQEENPLEVVEALEAQGLAVWVTLPRSVRGAMDVLWKLVELYRDHTAGVRLNTLEVTLDWAISSRETQIPFRYFCPLWQETGESGPWWVTFNQETYMSDLLGLFGGENVFAERQRQYPLAADLGLQAAEPPAGRDQRYPRVAQAEVLAARPDVILLPDEPFAFDAPQREQLAAWLAETPAVQSGRLKPFDGSLITWHGTRLARALGDLPDVLA